MTKLSFLHLALTNRGGAGIAAQRLHEAIIHDGHESIMLIDEGVEGLGVKVLGGALNTVVRTLSKVKYRLLAKQKYYFRDSMYDSFNVNLITDIIKKNDFDAIICHDLTNFLSVETLAKMTGHRNTRVIFMLMDMANFTGGCHYSWGCDQYQRICGHCHALRFPSATDRSMHHYRRKISAVSGMNAHVVAGSTSLAIQARSSSLYRYTPIDIIPIGVSPELFRPRETSLVREKFGLPIGRDVIFFGARQFDDERKGMAQMFAALEDMSSRFDPDRLPTLMIAGDGGSFDKLANLGFPVRSLGLVHPDMLAEAYSAASIFVCPSIEDSGPMMINEAVMSGTLVVGFGSGVLPDLIEDGVTGHNVEIGNVSELSNSIVNVLKWPIDKIYKGRARARQIGLERCSPAAQARSFVRIASGL
jgi:glycosyltransferase involved in cell wall biosynthesis